MLTNTLGNFSSRDVSLGTVHFELDLIVFHNFCMGESIWIEVQKLRRTPEDGHSVRPFINPAKLIISGTCLYSLLHSTSVVLLNETSVPINRNISIQQLYKPRFEFDECHRVISCILGRVCRWFS